VNFWHESRPLEKPADLLGAEEGVKAVVKILSAVESGAYV